LKQEKYDSSFKTSKKAVVIIEPLIFAAIKQSNDKALRENKAFMEKLTVLLIAYFNLGVSQNKLGNYSYAKTVFEHGVKMSKKFHGEEHYFTARFKRKL
jgi:hypothetical protein